MPSYTVSVAAATAVVGYDLAVDQRWKEQPNNRVLVGVALRGSVAAGDTEVDLYVDETRIATLFNNSTGFPDNDDVVSMNILVPGGAEFSAVVQDAPATNPINLRVDFAE